MPEQTKPAPEPDTSSVLRGLPWFADLSSQDLKEISAQCYFEHWNKRTQVMPVAKTRERLYIVLDGRVRIEALDPESGRPVTLYLLSRGDAHNIVTMLDGMPHDVLAETLDQVDAVSLPLPLMQKCLDTYPSVYKTAYQHAARRLRELNNLCEDLALHNTATRLAHLLLRHFTDETEGKDHPLHDLVHEDIANLIGSVRVVVTRLIKRFKKEGIIHTDGGTLFVSDLERLLGKAESKALRDEKSHLAPEKK